jgi:hypothetical protein
MVGSRHRSRTLSPSVVPAGLVAFLGIAPSTKVLGYFLSPYGLNSARDPARSHGKEAGWGLEASTATRLPAANRKSRNREPKNPSQK